MAITWPKPFEKYTSVSISTCDFEDLAANSKVPKLTEWHGLYKILEHSFTRPVAGFMISSSSTVMHDIATFVAAAALVEWAWNLDVFTPAFCKS